MDPLWADLVNSDWRDHRGSGAREDRLGNDAWLERFLARAGWCGGRLPGSEEREALRQLRTLLRRLVEVVRAGAALADEDLAALNRVLTASPLVRRLEPGEGRLSVALVPVTAGVEQLLATIAASFAATLVNGDPSRIKVCANPDCGWVIYDESHNRTRRWCDAAECGNLIKVRRYRERRRTTDG